MARGLWIGMISTALLMLHAPSALARSRPIGQLPKDLVRWSTLWVSIPQQMYAVNQEQGAVAALTWGPTKGAAMMIHATGKEVWDVMKVDESRRLSSREHKTGQMLFRYEF